MGKLQADAAKVIIGAAVIDDILGLLAVTMITQLAYGSFSIKSITVIIIKAVLYIVISAAFGIFVVRRYIERLDKCEFARKYPEFLVIFTMMMAFLSRLVAELTGLSCIIGACIAVISWSSIQLIHSNEFRKGTECLQIIFSAIFFASLEVIADFRTLIPTLVWFLVILTMVAIITRVVSCGIPANFFGISGKDSLIIWFGMVPRGEFAMIVACIGYNRVLSNREIYLILVIMSMMTTLFTPLVYRNWLFRKEKD